MDFWWNGHHANTKKDMFKVTWNPYHKCHKWVEKKIKKKKAQKDIKKLFFHLSELKDENLAPKKKLRKDKCHFCKKPVHYQKDCLKCKVWLEKKYNYTIFVCSESNLIEVPHNTWWIDYGTTTHVSSIM